jgi:hypothetical protein
LIDEYQLFVAPVSVGGGTRALPDDIVLRLRLVDERRFDNGMAHLRYEITPGRESRHGRTLCSSLTAGIGDIADVSRKARKRRRLAGIRTPSCRTRWRLCRTLTSSPSSFA